MALEYFSLQSSICTLCFLNIFVFNLTQFKKKCIQFWNKTNKQTKIKTKTKIKPKNKTKQNKTNKQTNKNKNKNKTYPAKKSLPNVTDKKNNNKLKKNNINGHQFLGGPLD